MPERMRRMDDFRIIYSILKQLRDSMDFDEFDSEGFSAERFKTTDNRFAALLEELQDNGYIKGLAGKRYLRSPGFIQKPMQPKITLKGLEYLQENSMMKKAAELAKGIAEIIM